MRNGNHGDRVGCNILILSDRRIDKDYAPIPSLLATSGLHHHLIREGTRTQRRWWSNPAKPREVHHFSLLIGYGASARSIRISRSRRWTT